MNAVECRKVKRDETGQVKQLWATCFQDTGTFVDWYFREYYRAENTLGIFDGTRLAASAQLIPYRLKVRDTDTDVAYLVGVDTDPAYRNRGYARELLRASLETMKQDGLGISILMPFEGRFYYRYGWQYYGLLQQANVTAEELGDAAKEWGEISQITEETLEKDIPALSRVYQAFTATYQGYALRDSQSWRKKLQDLAMDHGCCYVLRNPETKEAEGYLFYLPMKEQKVGFPEMAWTHETARKALLWAVQHLIPEGYRGQLYLPEDDKLVFELATDKTAVVRYPFIMVRIADVKQCLEQLAYPEGEYRFSLNVNDEFASWNSDTYAVSIAGGKATLTKAADPVQADAAISVDALGQLVMGAVTATELLRRGELTLQNEALLSTLDALWPKQVCYFNEYY